MDTMGIWNSQASVMRKNLRRLPWIVLLFCFFSVMYVFSGHDKPVIIGMLVVAGTLSILSFLGIIYLYFHKTSVKALISVQGLEVICLILSFSLSIYAGSRNAKIFQELPGYFFALYPLLAVPAILYGKYYAVKRWKPRAEWLATCARSGYTVGMYDLYENFFANPDTAIGKKLIIWVGLAAPATMLADHFFGGELIFIALGIFMTWAGSAMLANIVVRNQYVNASLAVRDLVIEPGIDNGFLGNIDNR